jgi:WD40 repeat protein
MFLTPGTLLQNRYLIQHPIAQGGMGVIYQATDQRLRHTVALKQTLFREPQLLEAFQREAYLLASLRHPSIPRVTDYFTEPHGQFLVMDFIPGDDLGTLLEQRGAPFPLHTVLEWADKLLEVLEYLHSQHPPVIHRDIKPQNIKILGSGQIALLDFGLAKGIPIFQTQVLHHRSLTAYTIAYAPLEQIQGSGTSPRSDIYAVGATLYHLISGRLPPDTLTRAAAPYTNQPDPLVPLHTINPHVPSAIGTIVMQALALNVEERLASAALMRTRLREHRRQSRDAFTPDRLHIHSGGQPTIVMPSSPPSSSPQAVPPPPSHPLPSVAPNAAPVLPATIPSLNFKEHSIYSIESIAFSPDGRLLAAASINKAIWIYEMPSGRLTQQLKGHRGWWVLGSVNSVAFGPDSRLLASAGADKTIRLWDIERGEQIHCLEGHQEEIDGVTFSPCGRLLASASHDKTVRLWDLTTMREHCTMEISEWARCVAFSPDSTLLASGGDDNLVWLWDTTSGRQLWRLQGHNGTVRSVAFSPDGTLLASAGGDKRICLWNVRRGQEVGQMKGHSKKIQSVAFSADGRLLASGSSDKAVRLWDVASRACLRILEAHTDRVASVTFSPDMRLLVSAGADAIIRLWGTGTTPAEWERIERVWDV